MLLLLESGDGGSDASSDGDQGDAERSLAVETGRRAPGVSRIVGIRVDLAAVQRLCRPVVVRERLVLRIFHVRVQTTELGQLKSGVASHYYWLQIILIICSALAVGQPVNSIFCI